MRSSKYDDIFDPLFPTSAHPPELDRETHPALRALGICIASICVVFMVGWMTVHG